MSPPAGSGRLRAPAVRGEEARREGVGLRKGISASLPHTPHPVPVRKLTFLRQHMPRERGDPWPDLPERAGLLWYLCKGMCMQESEKE